MYDEDEEPNEFEKKLSSIAIRDQIIEYFCECWTSDELKSLIDSGGFARPYCVLLLRHFANVKRTNLTNQQKLANILYEILGSKFLKIRGCLGLILLSIQEKDPEKWNHILKQTQLLSNL